MNKSELISRTKKFALEVIQLSDLSPYNAANKVLLNQLLRSGTSIGANYRAALRAKSRADFLYKIKIVEEEADESIYWLELIKESNDKPNQIIEVLLKEANELTAILHKLQLQQSYVKVKPHLQ